LSEHTNLTNLQTPQLKRSIDDPLELHHRMTQLLKQSTHNAIAALVNPDLYPGGCIIVPENTAVSLHYAV
jgi:hypothetical protein